ncbi:extracellular solute-binding protein [Arthrobacter crystallopoietes]|uniref:extracellular solute-binding protein n=1 Tax=Crystallibacter crystallopoietes TaxID=37928 RepID=UPI001ABE9A3B|nr:extracellular solute-binding protein [Arthrobacter crystallopoietes]QTG79577.1 extracellular solute-binding protein [Arthrobacter crystallopoietes]
MRKLAPITGFAIVGALLLSGCGSAANEADAAADDTLIVYTNSNSDGRGEWLTAEADKAGFDIEIVGAGGGDATNKIIAEKGNPVADVVFGLNNMYFEQLKAADTIAPYTPAWSGEVDAALADPAAEKSYWPLVQQGIVLAYNADALSAGEAPQEWTDLWTEDEFKKRYESVTGLGGATTQLVFAGILNDYKDPNGDLGISDEGWAQVEAYFDNGSPSVADKDLYARMADGEVDMGQMWSSGLTAREAEYGVDTEIMTPEAGVPFAVEQIGIIKGTENKDQAAEFIDWFGSAEVQGSWAKEFNAMPVNTAAIEQADPEVVKFHEELKRQDIDWTFAQENMGAWVEKIELEYMN